MSPDRRDEPNAPAGRAGAFLCQGPREAGTPVLVGPRARCAVPFCRRTAPTAEGYVDADFLCGPHWALRPPGMREAWRVHELARRRNPGVFWEHPPGSDARMVRVGIDREREELWRRTKATCIEIAMGVTA